MSWTCSGCGKIIDDQAKFCGQCGTGQDGSPAQEGFKNPHVVMDDPVEAVRIRYRKAYKLASLLQKFGDIIKLIGLLVGAFYVFAGISAGSLLVGVVGALVAAGSTVVTGYVVCAIGATLRNSTDSAVQTSPLLTAEERNDLLKPSN